MKHYFRTIIILFFSFLNLYSADGINRSIEIRILVANDLSNFELKTYGKIYATEEKTGEKYLLLENSLYDIRPEKNEKIIISDEKLLSPVYMENSTPESYIVIDGKKYRGKFKLANKNGKLNIIEYVDIERYLWGVLGPEMGANWPIEALKAQAVAARTYTLATLSKNNDYDMTNTTQHQVYTGFDNISPQIISAVNETRGEVLTYKNEIFTTFYHANSGGHTTTPSGVWNSKIIPPLRGVNDPYYKNSPSANWSVFISNSDILNFLNKNGHSVNRIKSFRIYSKDKSGRTVKFLFNTDKGSIKLEAKDLRSFIGTFDMKSTFITSIQSVKNGYKIYGRGWGHGVGLCQDGAKKMADKGFDYKKILSFYYPGSKIKDIDEVNHER
jgi:stage II sporulation protein D